MTRKGLRRFELDWEINARYDPMRAIANLPGKGVRASNPWSGEEFFAYGEILVAKFLESWDYQPTGQDRILEIGCGLGRLCRALGRRFGEVHGIDISPTMVERARRLNADFSNLHFQHGPGDRLPMYPDQYFDAVFSYIVFQHMSLETVLSYLTEIARILKPGGQAFLHIPYASEQIQPSLQKAMTPMSLLRLIRKRLHPLIRGMGLWRLAIRVWNPTITVSFDKGRVLRHAESTGLSVQGIREIPPISMNGLAHGPATFTLVTHAKLAVELSNR